MKILAFQQVGVDHGEQKARKKKRRKEEKESFGEEKEDPEIRENMRIMIEFSSYFVYKF